VGRANIEGKEWANRGDELFLAVAPGPRMRERLEDALRDAIRVGRLPVGARLPPTRTLARDLGVARGTVLAAYSQLATEGWIRGARGSATTVAVAPDAHATDDAAATDPRPPRFDLRPGRPDPSAFPRAEWLRAVRRALAEAPHDAFGYRSAEGIAALRTELAAYLRRARGLRVQADDLVVTTGFTQSLNLVAQALAATGARRVAMEEPSMPDHRAILRSAGLELSHVPVDADGACTDDLPPVALVALTPNRQHPLGVALAPARRAALLERARATGVLVLEDDYDGEFRYDGHPISALQSLEPGAVVYAGTVSKALAPGLRVGWLAVPATLRPAVVAAKERLDRHNGVVDQLALAEFLRAGAYDRHVRKMRLRYRRRRDAVLALLADAAPDFQVAGASAGLNLLLRLPDVETEQRLLAATAAHGVAVQGLAGGGYYESRPPDAGLVIGYAAAQEHAFAAALAALGRALRGR
jgi:GntR family transcriptional regulator/MocR family aminotransferase